jgi:hypothetical protein
MKNEPLSSCSSCDVRSARWARAGKSPRDVPTLRAALAVAAALLTFALLNGCAAVGPEEQRLVSKPNMQFAPSAVYNYSSKIMPQVLPGLATSGGAQSSTCTVCR